MMVFKEQQKEFQRIEQFMPAISGMDREKYLRVISGGTMVRVSEQLRDKNEDSVVVYESGEQLFLAGDGID